MVRHIVFRGTLAGTACVSLPLWKRVAPRSAPELQRTPGTLSPSPWPPSVHPLREGGVTCGWMNPLSQPVTCITWHYLLGRGHVQRMKEY